MAPLSHLRSILTICALLCLSGGTAFAQTTADLARGVVPQRQAPTVHTVNYQPAPAPSPPDAPAACQCSGVVFSVDGSACLRHIGDDLRQAVCQAHLPLEVVDFSWSNGPGRVFSDLRCQSHHKAKGQELADLILAQSRSCPGARIYLVCHSSGAAVVLAAVDCLPPGSVDRIILLAPAVSSSCDLRPALACAREGIDCYYSPLDLTSYALALFGTTDGCHLPSAGCLGFTPVADGSECCAYQNLRQHGWCAAMGGVGYYGGHYGCTRLGFFQTYVVPLLAEGTCER